jgi:death-on-curing family protein
MIKFLNLDYIKKNVIPTIHKSYVRDGNPAYDYLGEPKAMEQVDGCLERVRWDYAKEFISKAAQLFLCINKGHFFGNGNKRLALVTVLSFFIENGYGFRDNYDKGEYSEFLSNLFPRFNKFEDEYDFTSIDFAYYNLTIIVADSEGYGYSYEYLKEKVEKFFKYSVITPEEIEYYGDIYLKQLMSEE